MYRIPPSEAADDPVVSDETLFWLGQPGIHEDVEQARAEVERDETTSGDDLRVEFGLPAGRRQPNSSRHTT